MDHDTRPRIQLHLPDDNLYKVIFILRDYQEVLASQQKMLDRRGETGHIIDPRSGRPGGLWRLVSVSAPSATLADGLSTALSLLTETATARALAATLPTAAPDRLSSAIENV